LAKRRTRRQAAPVRIFINYRRGDTSGHAGRLYDGLVARFGAENVFMDVDTITPGTDYRKTIATAVGSCDVFIVLIGRVWLGIADSEGRRRLDEENDFVRLEVESALSRDLVVIPACVHGAEMPAADSLPPTLKPLADRQAVELRDSAWREDLQRLIRQLEHIREQRSEPPRSPEPRGATRRRWILLAVGALVGAGVVAAVALAVSGSGTRAGRGAAATGAREQITTKAQLLALIPSTIRGDCKPTTYGPSNAVVSVTCGIPYLDATYNLFASDRAMNGWYALAMATYLPNTTPGSGQCTGILFHGESRYTVSGRPLGRYFCYVAHDDGNPNLVSTDTRYGVGSDFQYYRGHTRAALKSFLREWRCCLGLAP
jgi:hypothetical protein